MPSRHRIILWPATFILCMLFLASPASSAAFDWLESHHYPLDDQEQVIARLVNKIDSQHRTVLLGEASHGTQEYYQWRRKLTQALVEQGRINFIAVEGDWAPLYALNRYIKDKPGAPASLEKAMAELQRWPQWMWNNPEIAKLGQWLREWNLTQPEDNRVGFYGLDAYAPEAAAQALLDYLSTEQPDSALSRNAITQFIVFSGDIPGYIRASRRLGNQPLAQLRAWRQELEQAPSGSSRFHARQSLEVLISAHQHYASMGQPGPASWNYRATHMQHSLERLHDHYGDNTRSVVWAHNTHIGDARATDMSRRGQVNIGQLSRQQWGNERVFALGFASHRGTVTAGTEWGATAQTMDLPKAAPGSLEDTLAQTFPDGALLSFAEAPQQAFSDSVGHRAVGVVYRPETDRLNYVPTVLPARYNALLFLPVTQAIDAR